MCYAVLCTDTRRGDRRRHGQRVSSLICNRCGLHVHAASGSAAAETRYSLASTAFRNQETPPTDTDPRGMTPTPNTKADRDAILPVRPLTFRKDQKMPGPVPKERKLGHATGKAIPKERIPARKPVKIPKEDPTWHPYALGFYRALQLSPLAGEYVETDWVMALVAAELISDQLYNGFVAMKIEQFNKISERLCCCLGDRRRARIELIRAGVDDDEIGAEADMREWQSKLHAVPDDAS